MCSSASCGARRRARRRGRRSRRWPARLGERGAHGVEARERAVVRLVADAAHDVGDEQDGAVGVVEDGEVGREHHRQLGHADVVDGGRRQPLHAPDGVVGHAADETAR
jgi:hypothetical protein